MRWACPLTLLRLDHTHEIGVLEMGMNHFGEIDYLSAIVEPDVVMITNIGDSHIEHLGSPGEYFQGQVRDLQPHEKGRPCHPQRG